MAAIDDGLGVGIASREAGSFRGLPRGLRSSRVFSVVRILRSTVPPFWFSSKITTEVLIT